MSKQRWGDEDDDDVYAEPEMKTVMARKRNDTKLKQAVLEKKKTTYCHYFHTPGGCRNGDQCNFIHEQLPCAFFLNGCRNEDTCPFSHDPEKCANAKVPHPCAAEGCTNFCLSKFCPRCRTQK